MALRIQPDLAGFEVRAGAATLIPVWAEILADTDTPVSVFRKLGGDSEFAFLLESVEHGETVGRYSFIGANPEILIRSRDGEVHVTHGVDEKSLRGVANPLEYVRDFMQRYTTAAEADPSLPPFIGGAVGYMAYDLVRRFEKLPSSNPDDLHLPDSYFMITDTLAIFDHLRHRTILLANAHVQGNDKAAYAAAVHKIERMAARLRQHFWDRNPSDLETTTSQSLTEAAAAAQLPVGSALHKIDESRPEPVPMTSNFSRDEFEARVERAKEYIRAGDAFQVVLSQRFSKPYAGDPFDIYRALRVINPSPYMYYLKFGDMQLAGSSPEILVNMKQGQISLRPIAGTRPRGATPEEDRALAEELMADPKERAEHIMLVDLGRNDLGRVAIAGSVRVDNLMIIERYSHVMHIVSNVIARVAPGKNAFDIIASCFPAGTVSGAPKIRAMQIIDELENVRRGPYAGAIGYISFDGNFDACITIRTCLIQNGQVYVQAGCGIVADSVPATEYQESCNKAMAVIKAVELAEAGLE